MKKQNNILRWEAALFLFFLLSLLSTSVPAQIDVRWVLQSEGKSHEFINSMAVDPYNNAYITGNFFDYPLLIQDSVLSSEDISIAAYVAKISPEGRVLYAKSIYSRNALPGYTYVDTDKEGNLYLAGFLGGRYLLYGRDTVRGEDTSEYKERAVFVKFDPTGRLLYSRVSEEVDTGFSVNSMQAIKVDTFHDCLYTVIKSYSKQIRFGDYIIRRPRDTTFFYGVYLVKWTLDGTPLWSYALYGRAYKGQNFFAPYSIGTNRKGDVWITGTVLNDGPDKRIYLQDTVLEYDFVPPDQNESGFVIYLNADGQYQWSKFLIVGEKIISTQISYDTRVDSEDNVYLNGAFRGHYMILDGDTIYNRNEKYWYYTSYLAKLTPDGDVVWAHTLALGNAYLGEEIAIDDEDNIYLKSSFNRDTIIIQGDTLYRKYQNSSDRDYDAVLTRYSKDGKLDFSYSYGGAGHDDPSPTGIIGKNEIIMTGYYGSTEFDLAGHTLTNPYGDKEEYGKPFNIFVARVKIDPKNGVIDVPEGYKGMRASYTPGLLKAWVSGPESPQEVRLYDLSGKVVRRAEPGENPGEYRFRLSGVPAGFYVVVAHYETGIKSVKVVVGE